MIYYSHNFLIVTIITLFFNILTLTFIKLIITKILKLLSKTNLRYLYLASTIILEITITSMNT